MNVRDIMRKDVVTANPDHTVRELTRLLAQHGISGMPVVNAAGEVLGVVSSSDVIRVAAGSDSIPLGGLPWINTSVPENTVDPEDPEPDPYSDFFLPEEAPIVGPGWDPGDQGGPMDQLSVADIMTPVSFSISGDATVAELAGFLVRGKIHRAVVIEDGRLAGIVTAVDVLRVVAEGPDA